MSLEETTPDTNLSPAPQEEASAAASPPPAEPSEPAEAPAAPKTLREELTSAIKESSNPPADKAKPSIEVKTEVPTTPKPDGPRLSNYLKNRHGEEWDKLPEKVKETFLSYESRVGQLASRYGQAAKEYENLQSVFAPYEEMVRSEGGTMATAMQSLLETARILRQGHPSQKLALLQALVDTFNVPAKVAPFEDASVNAPPELINRITQLEQQLLTQRAGETHNARTQVKQSLDNFISDPAHPYVHEDGFLDIMADLVEIGRAKDLDDAYAKAAMIHPVTQAKELSKRQSAEAERLAAEAAKRRSAASASLPSRSAATAPASNGKVSLRDELAARLRGESTL
jgi:hypothetical protein